MGFDPTIPTLARLCFTGCVSFYWSEGCGAAGPPIEEVGPSVVFDAAFGGEQGVGADFRPAAPRQLEPAPDDLLAGAFHDAGSDRQAALPAKVADIRSLLASKQSMQAATASSRLRCGFKPSITRAACPSSDCCLIPSIRACRPPWSGVKALIGFNTYWTVWGPAACSIRG